MINGANPETYYDNKPIPSDKCYQLLKHYEGCKLKAYQCSAGKWTIGYGATYYPDGRQVKQGDTITQDEAESMLPTILRTYAISVQQAIKTTLLQHQYDALCCLCYNIGIGAFERSTLLRNINAGASKDNIQKQWLSWDKARVNGVLKPLKGLTNRRQSEYHLFATGEVKYFN